MGEDEVENHEAGVDHLDGLAAPVAQIVLVDDAVNAARVEVVDVGVVGIGGDAGVAAVEDAGGQAVDQAALGLVGESRGIGAA